MPWNLLGGWRMRGPFYLHGGPQGNGGGLAIHFGQGVLAAVHGPMGTPSFGKIGLYDFDPRSFGPGPDVGRWPELVQHGELDFLNNWLEAEGQTDSQGHYVNGLAYLDVGGGQLKLFAVPRSIYPGQPLTTVVIKAADGERHEFNLQRQAFAGLVKLGNGQAFLGGGGYESGQGASAGPTLAIPGDPPTATPVLSYATVGTVEHMVPGAEAADGKPANWDLRAPRPPDYQVDCTKPDCHLGGGCDPEQLNVDHWIGWRTREIGGVGEIARQGRWASDTLAAGGLVLPDGISFWARQGVGILDYQNQCRPGGGHITFARLYQDHRVRRYRYDPVTYQLVGYEDWPDGLGGVEVHPVKGQELGPDGRMYLGLANRWNSGSDAFPLDPVIQVWEHCS